MKKKIQFLGLFIMVFLISGCSLNNDARSFLDSERLLVYDFTLALLQHDPIVYELTSPNSHNYLDEWFASTKAVKCHSPQLLSGGVAWEGEIGKGKSVKILCEGGNDPICSRIQIDALYFTEQIVNNESILKVTKWWDRMELCQGQRYYEEMVLRPLPYLDPPYSSEVDKLNWPHNLK